MHCTVSPLIFRDVHTFVLYIGFWRRCKEARKPQNVFVLRIPLPIIKCPGICELTFNDHSTCA